MDVILWRYESNDWREVCRLNGRTSGWMNEMEPMIAKSLKESRGQEETPDVNDIVQKLTAPIQAQYAALETDESREAFATALYTKLMFIVCEGWGGEAAG